MKRFLKIATLCLIAVLSVCCLFACGDGSPDGGESGNKSGLLYKKYGGDEYYTVYDYVDDGTGVTELDIGAAVPDGIIIGRIKAGAFQGNDTLVSVIVPSTVETIDEGAFAGMRKLAKITLPFTGASATGDAGYGDSASEEDKAVDAARTFGYIFGTESYNYGTQVTQYYDDANSVTYYMPLTLKEVTIAPSEDYNLPMYAFSGNTLISKVTLGDKVKVIGDGAFKDCSVLQTVAVPASVTEIGDKAFSGCAVLKDKNDDNGTGLSFADNAALVKIGDEAFKGTALTNVNIPSSVTEIGAGIFRESTVRNVVLPAGVTKISSYAFYKCDKLEKVTVSAVTEIGMYAFYDCDKLISYGTGAADGTVDLSGVTKLGGMSFAEIGKTFTVTNYGDLNLEEAFYNTEKIV